MKINQFLSKAFRRKLLAATEDEDTESTSGPTGSIGLRRTLGVRELTMLGVGSTLGAGVYVVSGAVAKNNTGPSIVVSFFIAGMASLLSALSYSEFAARVPRAGSAYVYSFVAVGELIAWITGWNLILEYIIGASAVARGWSGYMNSLTKHALSRWINGPAHDFLGGFLGNDPDFVAFGVTLLLSIVVACGVKESTRANTILTLVNLSVIAVSVFAGLGYSNTDNWKPFIPPEYGWTGTAAGAATCFFSYIGFDVIATSAEEAKNPARNVPIAIVTSLLMCMVAYMGVASVLTLMQPYTQLDTTAPLSAAFSAHHVHWVTTFINVGAVAGLSTSLMAAIFPLPRVVYAISSDGLLWPWLGKVSPRFGTPVNATAVAGLLAGGLALVFSISQLAEMMSIGTLMSYTLVSACVVVLRYERAPAAAPASAGGAWPTCAESPLLTNRVTNSPPLRMQPPPAAAAASGTSTQHVLHVPMIPSDEDSVNGSPVETTEDVKKVSPSEQEPPAMSLAGPASPPPASGARTHLLSSEMRVGPAARLGWWASFWNAVLQRHDGNNEFRAVIVCTLVMSALAMAGSGFIQLGGGAVWTFIAGGVCGLFVLLCMLVANSIPPRPQPLLRFKCPWVPLLPLFSIVVNCYLLMSLSVETWIRFAVWSVLGVGIYGLYGQAHSRSPVRQERSGSDWSD